MTVDRTSTETVRGGELAGEVSEHMREGKTGRAQQAFQRGWRDAVPELPLRFSVVLVLPDRDVVSSLHKLVRDGDEPEMELKRVKASVVEVVLTASSERVGNLPALDSRLLAEFGEDANLYRPQVLEIRYDERGRFAHVAVELVRPEVRYCTACEQKHTGPYPNCATCRAKRRPKGEERHEVSPVHFHDAIDSLAREPESTEDDFSF